MEIYAIPVAAVVIVGLLCIISNALDRKADEDLRRKFEREKQARRDF